jgi:hypothetical protein
VLVFARQRSTHLSRLKSNSPGTRLQRSVRHFRDVMTPLLSCALMIVASSLQFVYGWQLRVAHLRNTQPLRADTPVPLLDYFLPAASPVRVVQQYLTTMLCSTTRAGNTALLNGLAGSSNGIPSRVLWVLVRLCPQVWSCFPY